jgi:hypothetical protein
MSIEVILDVAGWTKEMDAWVLQYGCRPEEVTRFGKTWTTYSLNNCKPFHFYHNDQQQVRMFFWRKDQGLGLIFMMQFPDSVCRHNMDSTFKRTGTDD